MNWKKWEYVLDIYEEYELFVLLGWYFLAFDFCRFCVVIQFVHPRHNGQWPPTSKDFLSQIVSIKFMKEPVFPFFNVEC